MARLPVPGKDDGIWGDVLNDYLSQSLDSGGALLPSAVVASGAYFKPSTGIPKSDLSSSVQNSLTNADNTVAVVFQAQVVSAVLAIGTYSGLPTIDGVTLTDGQVALLAAESSSVNNGLWTVHSGSWTRPANWAAGQDVTGGIVFVQGGSSNPGSLWLVSGVSPKVVGTNGVSFNELRNFSDRGLVNAFSLYNMWDIVTLKDGSRVIITKPCQASGAGAISGANYALIDYLYTVDIRTYGAKVDGSTDDTTAIQNAINSFGTQGTSVRGQGGIVMIPAGTTRISATLDLPSNVHLRGVGWAASVIQLLPNSNCDMIHTHKSTGSGNSNAFWSSVSNLMLDGRYVSGSLQQGTTVSDCTISNGSTTITSAAQHTWTIGEYVQGIGILPGTTIAASAGLSATLSQAATVSASQNGSAGSASVLVGGDAAGRPWCGIYHETNPYNSSQTGDNQFDPTHHFYNLWIYGIAGDGIRVHGRSDVYIDHVKASFCMGNAFTVDFDTSINACMAEKPVGHGIQIPAHSSNRITGCKLYNTYGYGVLVQGAGGIGEITLAGIDIQQTNLEGLYIKTISSSIIAQAITVSQAGFSNKNGNVASGQDIASVVIDGSSHCIVDAACKDDCVGLKLINTAAQNDIRMTHSSSVSGAADMSANNQSPLGSTNRIVINGTVTNPVPSLAALTGDVTIASPSNGQGLVYNTSSSKWQNGSLVGTLSADTDVSITTPNDGQVLAYSASLGKWTNNTTSGIGSFYGNIFGNGSSGAVVLDGVTTIAGFTLSGSTYTLKMGFSYTNITINSGVTLNTGGAALQATGTITNNGTISNNGGNAAGATAGIAAGKLIYTAQAGRGGTTAAGLGGFNTNGVAAGSGGAGGAGTSGAGGAAGTTSSTNSTGYYANPQVVVTGALSFSGAVVPVGGGGSGGAGSGDGTNSGGGGGGSGGVVAILAHSLVNNGSISAIGGNGGTPATGNCGGGGGGGGGTIAIYTLTAMTGTGTTAVTAGSGGSATGTGSAGGTGGVGQVIQNIVV